MAFKAASLAISVTRDVLTLADRQQPGQTTFAVELLRHSLSKADAGANGFFKHLNPMLCSMNSAGQSQLPLPSSP